MYLPRCKELERQLLETHLQLTDAELIHFLKALKLLCPNFKLHSIKIEENEKKKKIAQVIDNIHTLDK